MFRLRNILCHFKQTLNRAARIFGAPSPCFFWPKIFPGERRKARGQSPLPRPRLGKTGDRAS